MFSPDYEKRILKHCSPVARNLFKSPESGSSLDRFIPCRNGNNWQTNFANFSKSNENSPQQNKKQRDCGESARDSLAYSCLLKNELLGAAIDDVKAVADDKPGYLSSSNRGLFNYQSPTKLEQNDQCPYSLSPVSIKSQKLLRSPRKATRKISRIPFKVLDAPELQDDFYLNLVDWSAQNVLAVGLGSCVYLWSACTSQVGETTNFLIFNCNLATDKAEISDKGVV